MKRWLFGSYLVVLSACGPDLGGLGAAEEQDEQPALPGLDGDEVPLPVLDAGGAAADAGVPGPYDASAVFDAAWPADASLPVDADIPPFVVLDSSVPPPVMPPPVMPPPVMPPPAMPPGPLTLGSPGFTAGERLPGPFTCVGGDASPPLVWSPGPAGTLSYAVTLSSPSDGWTWPSVQWVVWDIPADVNALPQGVKSGAEPSNVPGARQAGSSAIPLLFPSKRYQGPCGLGFPQQYIFTVYALAIGSLPNVSALAEPDSVAGAIVRSGKVLATSSLRTHFP